MADWIQEAKAKREEIINGYYSQTIDRLKNGARLVWVPEAWSQEIILLLRRDRCKVEVVDVKFGISKIKVDF